MQYETLEQGGYKFICKDVNSGYLLLNKGTNKLEWWFANKNHASYGLKFRGTHLEFASSADNEVPF